MYYGKIIYENYQNYQNIFINQQNKNDVFNTKGKMKIMSDRIVDNNVIHTIINRIMISVQYFLEK